MVDQDRLFSEAEAYERFMGRWSRRLAPLFVRFAGVRDGDIVLDAGAGTGALAGAVAAAAPNGRIVGIEPSAPYVAFARTKHAIQTISFEVGDARQVRFDNGTFDRTLSLLAVNFIPDPPKAIHELTRVTRRGGTMAAAVWDYRDRMEMLRFFWDTAIELNPADARRDERHMPFSGPGELAELWRGEGLLSVVEEALIIETRFDSFDDYWTPFMQQQGPAGVYVSKLPDTHRDELRRLLRRRLLGDGSDGPFALRARAWAVRGVVP